MVPRRWRRTKHDRQNKLRVNGHLIPPGFGSVLGSFERFVSMIGTKRRSVRVDSGKHILVWVIHQHFHLVDLCTV